MAQHRAVVLMCNEAYGDDLTGYVATFGEAEHVLGFVGSKLVTHAMWVTRWLAPEAASPLKTAYVEMVATKPKFERRGYATKAMRLLQSLIPASYALAALCPTTKPIYQRLGWRTWFGPLSIRQPNGELEPTPDEEVMVLTLPQSPRLDHTTSLSAEWRYGELW